MPKTKVFLTWSGQRSNAVATALRKWLPRVIQSLDPWMSETDMDKGTQWSSEISVQLRQSKIGIICLTPENLGEPWINFEAGALSKLEGSIVCTFLYDLAMKSIQYPLAQFQSTKAEKEDTKNLLVTINKALLDEGLPVEQLTEAFEKWWPELSTALSQITQPPSVPDPPRRSSDDVLEELVSAIRETSHTQTTILTAVSQISNALQEERQTRQSLLTRNAMADVLTNRILQSGEAPISLGFGYRRVRRPVQPGSKLPRESEGKEPDKKA